MNIPGLIGILVYVAIGGAVGLGLSWVFIRALFFLIGL